MLKCPEPDCPAEEETEQALASHHYNAHKRVYERKSIEHGTIAGYQAHRRRKEQACAACREAWRSYYKNRSSSSK